MAEKNIKRVSLYFNMDNPIEKKMWEYLQNSRSKSNAIKNLLENELNDSKIQKMYIEKNEKSDLSNKNELNKDELDPSGMAGF